MPLLGTQPGGNRSGPLTPGTAPGARMTPSLARRCLSGWAGPRARWVLGFPADSLTFKPSLQTMARWIVLFYFILLFYFWRAWAEVGKVPLNTSKSEWKMTAMALEPMLLMRWTHTQGISNFCGNVDMQWLIDWSFLHSEKKVTVRHCGTCSALSISAVW